MKRSCEGRLAALVCLLLANGACQRAETDRPKPGSHEPTKLCGLPFADPYQARIRPGPGVQGVEIPGAIGSFQVDNMGSAQPNSCSFELIGPGVKTGSVFSRYGPKDQARVAFALEAPGRMRVTYEIPQHSYGLISVEPPVEVPPDPNRFVRAGVEHRISGGVLLRFEDSRPLVRSLGPATRVDLKNPADEAAEVDFVVDNSSDRLSRVVLTGLANGRAKRISSLRIRVNGRLAAQGEASLVLEPRPLRRPWSFVFGGDVKQELGTFMQLLEQVRLKHDPLFMIGAGDYTRNSLPQELQAYLERTADVPFPIYPVKGNHELRAQGERHYARLFGPDRYAFTIDSALFVVLDSTAYEREGDLTGFALGADQLAWLDRTLSAHEGLPLKFVALHVPPQPLHGDSLRPDYPSNMLPSQAEKLIALATRHRVSYVLSGHAHLFARAAEHGTVYLVSGGGGAELYSHKQVPGFDIDTRKHLMVLTVTASGVDEQRVPLPRPAGHSK